jgi:formate-nitrite transporter family protein
MDPQLTHGQHSNNLDPEAEAHAAIDSAAAAPMERSEYERVAERQRLRAPLIYEIIRRDGLAELTRPVSALWWSGMSAGIGVGFSVTTEGLIRAHLPDTEWRPLVENFGYTVGFLIVILGRLQLFTENTITAVIPLCATLDRYSFLRTARLWGIVLLANLAGTVVFAAGLAWSPPSDSHLVEAVTELSSELMSHDWLDMVAGGVVAGWLIASLVWIMPSIHTSPALLIIIVTYVIALGDFTHVIAGSVEAAFLVIRGQLAPLAALTDFLVPALIGNILGGTVLFTLLAYSQVREEVEHH